MDDQDKVTTAEMPVPPSNAEKYGAQRDNYGKPRADYITKLEAMSDDELYKGHGANDLAFGLRRQQPAL